MKERNGLTDFLLSNSDVKKKVFSFYFGDEDKIDCLHNQFYSTIDVALLAKSFQKCHLTHWLCNTVIVKMMYKQPVKRLLKFISLIPDKFLTFGFYQSIIQNEPYSIIYLPQTFKLRNLALSYDPKLIFQLHHTDAALWQIALALDINIIHHMPYSIFTGKLCASLVERNAMYGFPNNYRICKIYEFAIRENPRYISQIPPHSLTMELCSLAVSLDINMMEVIPWKKRMKEDYL